MNTTTYRRIGGLVAWGAVGLLAAGCSGGAGSTVGAAGGADDAADPPAAQIDGAAQVDGAAPNANAQASGKFTLPESWQGTLAAVPGELDGSEYVALENNYGADQPTSVSGERIAGGEFLAGTDARCEGTAVLNGEAATCTFVDSSASGDQTARAMVRLVPTGFGNTGLIFHVTHGTDPAFTVPSDVPIGQAVVDPTDPAVVTESDIDSAAISGIMMGQHPDGDLPSGLVADCDLEADGLHAVCDMSGTPDGAADGTWYATAHRSYGGDTLSYVFSRLPQE